MAYLQIGNRKIGRQYQPFVIPEIGINHEGDFGKAKKMVYDAYKSGAQCVKFQCHIIEDEMIYNDVIPGNAKESIWEIMSRCTLTYDEEIALKQYVEDLGMIYISTPFSRAAADRLQEMCVQVFKIGSGECNNYPLVKHIAAFGKPVILSTGMNDISSIQKSVDILEGAGVSYAIMHCTSMYPTPYEKVRLGAIQLLADAFPNAVLGLSDHSLGNYTCFASIALGCSIVEKHFTSDKSWPGPDVPISIDPDELSQLVAGTKAIHKAMGGSKEILVEEQPTIDFAYASVVAIRDIMQGEVFTLDNIWVKRPGTGQIKAVDFERLLGKRAIMNINKDTQIQWRMIDE